MRVVGDLVDAPDRPIKYKVRGNIVAGAFVIGSGTAGGEVLVTTTSPADVFGIAQSAVTYSATQGDTEGVTTVVSASPYAIAQARVSGSSTTGTSMTTLVNTSAETAGTTITDADVGSNSMVGGTVFCLKGANKGQSRIITTHNSAQDFVVTVPFLNDIALNDEFIWVPYSRGGDGTDTTDGAGDLQTTGTDFLEADGSVASGSGGVVAVLDILWKTAADTEVAFLSMDHAYGVATI